MNNRRKSKFIKSPLQRKLLVFIFFSSVIPTTVAMLCLYYLIFTLLAQQIAIPEAIACNLMPVVWKVSLIFLVGLPVLLSLIWFIAVELSHRIIAPLFRVERELDAIIAGEKRGPIKVRQKDEFKSLVDKINKLVDKK